MQRSCLISFIALYRVADSSAIANRLPTMVGPLTDASGDMRCLQLQATLLHTYGIHSSDLGQTKFNFLTR
jgi:hypothetical protein